MNYNPYSNEYDNLKQLLEDKTLENKKLLEQLHWFDTTDISNLHFELKNKEEDKNNLQKKIDTINNKIDDIKSTIYIHRKYKKTLLNPLNWFNEEQRMRRKRLKKLDKEWSSEIISRTKIEREVSKVDELIKQYKSDIHTYTHFNRENINDKLTESNNKIVFLEEEIKSIYELKIKVDKKLEPILSQIEDLEKDISIIQKRESSAQSFENALDNAKNSYEKRKIHENCENDLGDSSPKKIIRESENFLKKLQRDLDKAKTRASIVSEKAIREIHKIIIDGNNLCYEGSKFVGLKPLITLTLELERNYQIIVVFDSAIRSMLNTNDKSINKQFSEKIKTHIVASKQLADETILDIASNDTFCYIISNDRFGEYKDKEVVKNGRIIRHEIIDGNMLVHDLSINEKY
ncbi:coiled-coil domain-containing protein [Arcobacter sp.]|uniref:coiled-coil domain-containing protein n=1 Tax=Arcobacter sp. TaxID=1872629 RepID=UPI003D10D116